MIHSKLAIHSIDEIASKRKDLEHSWKFFMTENTIPNTIRSAVQASWKRCKAYGVDPLQQHSPISLNEDDLKELIHTSNLYHASQPVLKDLHQQIKHTGHLITLSDDKGRIIHIEGEDKIKLQAQNMNFTIGADWSEEVAGSNAIGTSLAAKQPIQIFSYEHFCEGVHPWICSAAPIVDPYSKRILGIIDLTGPSDKAQPHSLMVVQYISNLIGTQLMKSATERMKYLQSIYEEEQRKRNSVHVVVLDEMLNVAFGDKNSFFDLQIDNWNDFWRHEQMLSLKASLLNSKYDDTHYEHERDIEALQLKIFIRSISFYNEQIGFILFIERIRPKTFSTTNISNDILFKDIIGMSPKIIELKEKMEVIAKTTVPALIMGESGTGKELVAYALHQASGREGQPFIAMNCGAIPNELIASELFGYEGGTFTGSNSSGRIGKFEEAEGGTLFLDEIGEMPVDLQVHLLRVLQEKEVVRLGSSKPIPVNTRIIAATNKNITTMMEQGEFRTDLYYRLNVVELLIPSLKERIEDIELLCHYFIEEFAEAHGKEVPTIEDEVYHLFYNYDWPGNVRELMNALEYAILFHDGGIISTNCLPNSIQRLNKKYTQQEREVLSPLQMKEKMKLQELIIETNGNLSEVARRCKIARTTLYRKIEKYHLKY